MLLLRLGIICYGDNVKQTVREFLLQKQCDAHSFRMSRKFRTWARNWTQSPRPVHFPTGSEGKTLYGSLEQQFDNLFWDLQILHLPQFLYEVHPEKNPINIDLKLYLVLLICTFYLALPGLAQAEKPEH